MVLSTVASSDRIYEATKVDGGEIGDFRPVLDLQTLDFLQTVTDCGYRREDWETCGQDMTKNVKLIEITGEIHKRRLGVISSAKDAMGLSAPVL